ncbi:TM2 domain-containing protein, partial [Brachyspira hampsonii 30599]
SDLNNIKANITESIESVIIYLNKVLENIQKDDIMDITSDIDVLKAELKKTVMFNKEIIKWIATAYIKELI